MGPTIRLAAAGRQTALYVPLRQNCPRILGLAKVHPKSQRTEGKGTTCSIQCPRKSLLAAITTLCILRRQHS